MDTADYAKQARNEQRKQYRWANTAESVALKADAAARAAYQLATELQEAGMRDLAKLKEQEAGELKGTAERYNGLHEWHLMLARSAGDRARAYDTTRTT